MLSLLAQAFEALDQRSKTVSVLKELARILGENGDAPRARRDLAQDPAAGAGRSRRRGGADQSGPGAAAVAAVARRGAGVAAAARPRHRRRRAGRARPAGQLDGRAAGGDERIGRACAPSTTSTAGATGRSSRRRSSRSRIRRRAASRPTPTTRRPTAPSAAGAEEEIAKILNETDVYIKYNLHAKAIEHLQRAFERNPRARRGAREAQGALPHHRQEGRGGARALVARRECRAGAQAALPARDPRDRSAQRARRRRAGRAAGAGQRRSDRGHRRVRLAAAGGARFREHRARRCSTSKISRSSSDDEFEVAEPSMRVPRVRFDDILPPTHRSPPARSR